MAKHLFPGQDPVGKEINMMVIGSVQIVGVAGHLKHFGLDGDATAKIRDEMYFPFAQIPDNYMPEIVVGANLLAVHRGRSVHRCFGRSCPSGRPYQRSADVPRRER